MLAKNECNQFDCNQPNSIALISGILSDKQVSVWHSGAIIRRFFMVCLIVGLNAKQKLGKRDFYKEAIKGAYKAVDKQVAKVVKKYSSATSSLRVSPDLERESRMVPLR